MTSKRPFSLTLAIYIGALFLAALAIGPGFYLVLGALQPVGTDAGNPLSQMFDWNRYFVYLSPLDLTIRIPIPTHPSTWFTTTNLTTAWEDANLARPIFNSVIVTFARAGLNVLLAALAAYPLARMDFKFRRPLFLLILATVMIPEQVIVVPMFRIASSMGLYDTLAGAVIPFSVSAFGIFMCRQAFLGVPKEIEEAATVDGASSFRIWWSLMLPLTMPTLATLALFSVIFAWSDLLWPLIILQSPENYTLPVAISSLLGTFSTNPRVAYAASVLALIPIVVLFICIARFMTPQMFGGSVKG